ncbi:glycosyltransferase involved in cell wall biosynthesis [Friedmanniella endophytica]|uniref:Glycosyltransferase involved in cell wall biosynthesis n=1 Tax=Microlunatus kandeliicorticis TaxID=1759536 RepID=A0A7W3IRL7_9ACTN|nr:glycosyltransferase family 2 protein [Microlunatus kandeliicorticis]MBA8793956.1 glycosyltransferase involved in cell wall biosynthesis [Microlunatus kandeliicorticis]
MTDTGAPPPAPSPRSVVDDPAARSVEVVLPCLDEALALPGLLADVPAGWRVLVVDNNSTDDTAAVARGGGARVIAEGRAGYGAAVHAGIASATADIVAVIDGDGSLDPAELVEPVRMIVDGRADLVCGRRRPVARRVWPWHARLGTLFLAGLIRVGSGVPVHDIAPVRVARREALLALDLRDRRCGYPLETILAAARAGWRIVEVDVSYRARAVGSRSKISGTVRGTVTVARDFAAVLVAARRPRRRGPATSGPPAQQTERP